MIFGNYIIIERMKYKKIGVLIFLFIVMLWGVLYFIKDVSNKTPTLIDMPVSAVDDPIIYDEILIKVAQNNFSVLIADTPQKRALGLSGRKELSGGKGMLFVFEKPGDYPFWMKDMNFAIDILWINENNEIIHILENLSPETYPESFASEKDSLYVLEFPAGTVVEAGVKLGDKIVYKP